MRRRVAQQHSLHSIGDDQPGLGRQYGLRKVDINGEEQCIRKIPIFWPVAVNQKVTRTGFDLDANKSAIRA